MGQSVGIYYLLGQLLHQLPKVNYCHLGGGMEENSIKSLHYNMSMIHADSRMNNNKKRTAIQLRYCFGMCCRCFVWSWCDHSLLMHGRYFNEECRTWGGIGSEMEKELSSQFTTAILAFGYSTLPWYCSTLRFLVIYLLVTTTITILTPRTVFAKFI